MDQRNLWIFAVLILSFGALFFSFSHQNFSNEISGAAVSTLGTSRQVSLQSGAEKGCTSATEFMTGVYIRDSTGKFIDKVQCKTHGLSLPNTESRITPPGVSKWYSKDSKCTANYVAATLKKTDYGKVSTINYFNCRKLPNGYTTINEEYKEIYYGNSAPLGYIPLCPGNKAVIGFTIADEGNGDFPKKIICADVDDGQTQGPGPLLPVDGTCTNGQFQILMGSDTATTANGNPSVEVTNNAWQFNLGQKWIWSSGDRDSTQDTTVNFQRQFILPNSISNVAANVVVGADNRYSCTLNNQNIGGDSSDYNYRNGDWDSYSFNSLPQTGTNTFACSVTNIGLAGSTFNTNPGGLVYALNISGQCSNQTNATQCSDGIDNNDPEDTLADYPNDPGCTSLADNDETNTITPPPNNTNTTNGTNQTFPPPPNATNTTNTTNNDLFPNDPCSFGALNDKCGYTSCNSDLDGDGYFTDSFTSDANHYGCDKKRGDHCSALTLNDLNGLAAPTIPTGGVISTEGIEIPVNGYFEIFADAYSTPRPNEGWPKIVKFKGNSQFEINNQTIDATNALVSGGESFIFTIGTNGKLLIDMDADGMITVNKKIPVPLTSCSATTGNACEITSVAWITSSNVKEGDQTQLQVNTNALCNGKTIIFSVFEHDALGDDPASISPVPVVITNGIGTGTWIAEYQDNDEILILNNRYYFQASVENSQMKSNDLQVNKNTAGTACGNNIVEGTEDCFTCSKDAGCLSGQLCCVSTQGYASCATSCGNPQPNNGDNVCDNGNNLQTNQKENCGLQACDEKNSGCVEGNICSSNLCACNPDPDNICSKDNACKTIDPDCDKDGDTKVEGDDNCPSVKNADQTDADLDSIGCKYDFEKTGLHVNPGLNLYCGGDACDIDDDNDGVCDAGATTTGLLCKGQDKCDGTAFGAEVDDDGCSTEQAKCLLAWDCTNVQWSACDPSTGTRTRNIGDCSSYENVVEKNLCRCTISADIDKTCFQSLTLPKSEACDVEQIEQEVPFFGWMNFLAAVGLLSAYYILRKK